MILRSDAKLYGMCPECFQPNDKKADICCPNCAELRRAALTELATRGCGGQSCTDEMEAKMSAPAGGGRDSEWLKMQSGARNGRVMRKGEIYGG